MSSMRIGGVSVNSPWWGTLNVDLKPTAPSPNDLTSFTVMVGAGETELSITGNADTRGLLDHVSPVVGAVGLAIGVVSKLHPATRVAGFVIAVGLAVLNWGSSSA